MKASRSVFTSDRRFHAVLGRHRRCPLSAASSMTFATSAGCDNIATWLDGSTVALALICVAMLFSCSGSIMRSLLDTTYHAGFARQAAAVGLASKMAPEVFGCAATR